MPSEAFDQGKEAHAQPNTQAECPHEAGTIEHRDWHAGRRVAQHKHFHERSKAAMALKIARDRKKAADKGHE